jgi:hypothetical protein
MASRVPPEQRFWSKVDKRGPDECWPWVGGVDGRGYGRSRYNGSGRTTAHRIAWQLANGRDALLFVLHRCDNPVCCNPAHLWEGTQSENMRDMAAKGRWNNGHRDDPPKTHCIHGHEFTPENTTLWSGHRVCRTCSRLRDARRYQQLKKRG